MAAPVLKLNLQWVTQRGSCSWWGTVVRKRYGRRAVPFSVAHFLGFELCVIGGKADGEAYATCSAGGLVVPDQMFDNIGDAMLYLEGEVAAMIMGQSEPVMLNVDGKPFSMAWNSVVARDNQDRIGTTENR